MKRRTLSLLTLLLFLLSLPIHAAAEDAPTPIFTAAALQAMEPEGHYILMEDLDLAGMAWTPIDFSGSFDGNGHAILNLTLTTPASSTAKCYDGNSKSYLPEYYGLFGLLENATVQNLNLVNVRCRIEAEGSAMIGSLAGFSSHSLIQNCSVTASLELRAHTGMFGLGGLVGYGTGSIENCAVDAQLICVDTDSKTVDEQFLGGVYAAGFLDVRNCSIAIDGWISEHGYVHSGGIVGMFMRYPIGEGIEGEITGNFVSGKITFFENNPDRRAYCKAYAGEILGRYCTVENNTNDFVRDEIWDYTRELRPHSCAAPVWTAYVVPSGCQEFGYTRFCCTCGYSYDDCYTLYTHTVTDWEPLIPATTEAEGLSEGKCSLCGAVQQRTEPVLPPESTVTVPSEPISTEAPPLPTESTPQPSQATAPAPVQEPEAPVSGFPWLLSGLLLLAAGGIFLGILPCRPRKKGKYEK